MGNSDEVERVRKDWRFDEYAGFLCPSKSEVPVALSSTLHRWDLAGAAVNGIFANYPGFEIESELRDRNGTLEFVGGFSVLVFLDLAYILNFTPIPVQSSGWMWKDYATGEWHGTGGQLMRGEGDVAASITVLSDERADFEFLPAITSRHIFAFFVQPPLSDLRDIFEQPLDFRLCWVAAGIHLTTFLIVVTIQWLRLNLGQTQRDTAADLDFRSSIGLVIVTCTCLKNWYRIPDSYRLRWTFLCTSLFGFLLYTAFSAALVSTLSSETLPIKNMQDLLSSGMLIAGDSYIPYVVTTLERVHGTDDHEEIKKRGAMFGLAQAPPLVQQRKLAFLATSDEFTPAFRSSIFNDSTYCRFVSSVKASTLPTPLGMLMRKGSSYVEHFKFGTIKLIERGVSYRRVSHYKVGSEIQCRRKEIQYRKDLKIADVLTAYVILGVGTVFSFICALTENLFSSFSRLRAVQHRISASTVAPESAAVVSAGTSSFITSRG